MSAAPILIAQISDLHIKRKGELAYRRVDTAKALETCIETLNALRPRPELVVITGDLADTAAADEYEHLKALLAPLELPFVSLPGNHDSRELLRAAFADQNYAAPSGGLNQLRPLGALDLVLLDSSVPQQPHGELDEATLRWLESTLAASERRPALLFLHHPPFVTGVAHMDRMNLRDADQFATIVRRHERVRLIACGHVHRATFTSFAEVPTTICPAPNHAVDLDLAEARAPSFRVEPPAFHLHAWFEGGPFGTVVTHTVPIGQFDGPHPFFGSDGKLL
jgi:3',5'-cyclic-AMP phosphodiesterase